MKSLFIYPIKGMMGTSVQSATTLERGFKHDRRYMLVDEKGTFISQRTHPDLVHFSPNIVDEAMEVYHKEDILTISLSHTSKSKIATTIFGNSVQATLVSKDADQWFSDRLNEEVRLVKMEDSDIRHKKLIKGPSEVEVSFADGYPYLIIGTESLALLNSKLDESISINRFRPNIILETNQAHEEDVWENITIGNGHFFIVKPCARCQVVTVDQKSGLKSKEPLRTLATYRKKDNLIYFGANAISRNSSAIHIGDEVIVL